MRKIYFILIFISLFILSLLSLFNTIQYVSANFDDLEYEFENDVLYSGNGNFPNSTYNLRNQTIFTQHYNATYSFENDDNDILPNDWDDNSGSECTAIVIWNKEGHNKVFQLYDGSNTEKVDVNNSFIGQTSGIIELWWMVSDSTELQYIKLTESGSLKILLRIHGGILEYHDGNYQSVIDIVNNQWYHIGIDFDCITDTCDIYVNGIKYINGLDFNSISDVIDGVSLYTDPTYTDFYNYFDGFGYSWNESYNLGMNFIPYSYINEFIQEIMKWEFAHYPNGTLYPIGYDNANNWTDIEPSGDKVNIAYDDANDMRVDFAQTIIGNMGLEKDFEITEGIINLTTEFWVKLDNQNGYLNYSVYSYDDTLIVRLHFIQDLVYPSSNIKLYYWNGINNIFLYDILEGIIEDYIFHNGFNLYINNYDGIAILSLEYYNLDYPIYETLYFPLIDYKDGLGKIEVLSNMPDTSHNDYIYLDSIGILINGSSIVDNEFGYMICNMTGDIPEWYIKHHNQFTLNANGTFAFSIYGNYGGGFTLTDIITYNDTDRFFNLYNGSKPFWNIFIYYLFNESFQINSILIEGSKLTEGTNEYWLEFEYENVDTSESYFYVIGNKLHFKLNVKDIDILETINATFDIENLYSTSRSMSFHSDFNGDSIGIFAINYLGNKFRMFELPNYPTSRNIILHQGLTINKFIIYITDNNYNYTLGLNTGYISGIKLVYLPNIEFTMLTTTIMKMLVPLMIILLPTIAIYSKFGKDSVVPMLIIMSVICYVSNLIPVELFFVIMFSCSVFVIESYKGREKT